MKTFLKTGVCVYIYIYICCSFPHIQYGHPPSHLSSQRFRKHIFFISSVLCYKWKSLMFFSLSCNDNNYMTYKWPNSSFFNFEENTNQENCRQCSRIIFLIDKLEQKTWRKENLSFNQVFSQVGQCLGGVVVNTSALESRGRGFKSRSRQFLELHLCSFISFFHWFQFICVMYIYIYIFKQQFH